MPDETRSSAIEAAAVPPARATRGYPEPFAARVAGTRKAGARRCVRIDQFRCEPDAVAARRHVGAAPYSYARGRIHLHYRGRAPARDQCRRDAVASRDVPRFQSRLGRRPPPDQHAADATLSIWRSATAIPEIPSSTRTRTLAERSPRAASASLCIGTARRIETPELA